MNGSKEVRGVVSIPVSHLWKGAVMQKNAIVSVVMGMSYALLTTVLLGPSATFGAVLWEGSVSNDFNSSANWVQDDNFNDHSGSPTNANCYLYKPGAGHLTDMNVTADISVFSLNMKWAGSTSPVTVGSTGGHTIAFPFAGMNRGLTSENAGLGTMTVGANLQIASTNDGQHWNINNNVVVNGNISASAEADANSRGFTKYGTATLTLNGANTFRGDVNVSAGTVTLGSTGSRLMDVNNSSYSEFTSTGTGALILNGMLKLDVADVTTPTGSWNLVHVDVLNETYGGTFSVATADGTSYANSNGVWSHIDGTKMWSFSQSTGILTLLQIPEPGTSVLLLTSAIGLLAYAWRRRK